MKLLIAALVMLTAHLTLAAETGHGGGKPKFIIYENEAPVHANAVIPGRPKILSPEPLKVVSEADVVLKWNPVQDADAYSVQVSDDVNFFKLLVNEGLYAQTEYTFKGAEKGKNYYWRVAALRTTNKPGAMKSLYNRSSFTAQ
jgi:hypothetical protein